MQSTLEETFQAVVGSQATFVASGRTDRGVHARMQVVAFRAPSRGSPDWEAPFRQHLPDALGVVQARVAPKGWHPQWTASGKTYRYRLLLGRREHPCAWTPELELPSGGVALGPDRLAELLRQAQGTRDFGAFHPNSSSRRLRTLERTQVTEWPGGLLDVELSGNGFARHQLRYLIGSAVLTAKGQRSQAEWQAALEQTLPMQGLRAPARALLLWEVRYPAKLDPFTPQERALGMGVPNSAPFVMRLSPSD